MVKQLKTVHPPKGIARLAFRLPILFYRFGLGWMMGNRFLQLTHTGRKSGLPRKTVLEVVDYDPATGNYYAAAGFGSKSDWVRNIQANPEVEVQSGREKTRARAVALPPEEAGERLLCYARRHPLAFQELVKFMGYEVDGSDEDIRALGGYIRLFSFQPLPSEAN